MRGSDSMATLVGSSRGLSPAPSCNSQSRSPSQCSSRSTSASYRTQSSASESLLLGASMDERKQRFVIAHQTRVAAERREQLQKQRLEKDKGTIDRRSQMDLMKDVPQSPLSTQQPRKPATATEVDPKRAAVDKTVDPVAKRSMDRKQELGGISQGFAWLPRKKSSMATLCREDADKEAKSREKKLRSASKSRR
eukprot:gnl/TRDRNA2_/TRDRNA2_182411_c0_seq1.p1 gnl/TRDRNA2_/TRDRNA2_182411_c0~~gnl/TRDRNA2_/TRDRNA2_182411_c0_seq1.p1  ORF type:complete len:194 (-),score=18.66 gnl/TRDRNA2_/TRDRNA2_182411_c0_seq1:17-598(-)